MSLSRMLSVSLIGLDALPVEVEVDVGCCDDKTVLVIVGLPDTAVKESKDRVLTAIKNSGYSVSNLFCTVNLAPGSLRKEGAFYDLPIALGLLRSMQAVDSSVHDDYLFVENLALAGNCARSTALLQALC